MPEIPPLSLISHIQNFVETPRSCPRSVPNASQILLAFRKQLSLITVCIQNFVEL